MTQKRVKMNRWNRIPVITLAVGRAVVSPSYLIYEIHIIAFCYNARVVFPRKVL